MTRLTRGPLLSALVLALAACGGGAKLGAGKEGAAQAVFQASQPAGRGGTSGQALDVRAMLSGATGTAHTVSCSHGGSVTLTLDTGDVAVDPQTGAFHYAYDVAYDGCSEDGKNTYDGAMHTTVSGTFSTTDVQLTLGMKGRLDIHGEVDDFVDADVTLVMAAAATSRTEGTASITFNGTIATSSGSYVYTDEHLDVTAGALPRG